MPVCVGMSVPSAQRPLLGMPEGPLGEEVVLEVELESHALGFPRGVANEELGDSRWRRPTQAWTQSTCGGRLPAPPAPVSPACCPCWDAAETSAHPARGPDSTRPGWAWRLSQNHASPSRRHPEAPRAAGPCVPVGSAPPRRPELPVAACVPAITVRRLPTWPFSFLHLWPRRARSDFRLGPLSSCDPRAPRRGWSLLLGLGPALETVPHSSGAWAWLLHNMWDLPGPGIEPADSHPTDPRGSPWPFSVVNSARLCVLSFFVLCLSSVQSSRSVVSNSTTP